MLCWCILLGLSVLALEGTIGYFAWKLEYGALAVTIVASVNGFTYLMNVIDKCCACACERDGCVLRVPECVLHLLSFAGGAPATALAMLIPCHKSAKTSYQDCFCVVACVLALVLVAGVAAIEIIYAEQCIPG